MSIEELVDAELAKLWPERGLCGRGFPDWEVRLAIKAMTDLRNSGRQSKLHEWCMKSDMFEGRSWWKKNDLYKYLYKGVK